MGITTFLTTMGSPDACYPLQAWLLELIRVLQELDIDYMPILVCGTGAADPTTPAMPELEALIPSPPADNVIAVWTNTTTGLDTVYIKCSGTWYGQGIVMGATSGGGAQFAIGESLTASVPAIDSAGEVSNGTDITNLNALFGGSNPSADAHVLWADTTSSPYSWSSYWWDFDNSIWYGAPSGGGSAVGIVQMSENSDSTFRTTNVADRNWRIYGNAGNTLTKMYTNSYFLCILTATNNKATGPTGGGDFQAQLKRNDGVYSGDPDTGSFGQMLDLCGHSLRSYIGRTATVWGTVANGEPAGTTVSVLTRIRNYPDNIGLAAGEYGGLTRHAMIMMEVAY